MKEITSVQNNFIKDLIKLKQKKYRDKEKKFIVEGYNIIEEAKNYLSLLLITNKEDINLYKDVEHILVTYDIIKKLTDTVTPQGIIGICNYKESKDVYANNVLVLDGLQDPGNIGTIIRSALCFDFKTIIMSLDSCDIYNEKVIRATQGAIFNIDIKKCDIKEELVHLKNKGYKIVGTALENGKELNSIVFGEKNAIILGNEGNGVSKDVLASTDVNAYIPINKEMESLNVAIAGAIIMNKVRNR